MLFDCEQLTALQMRKHRATTNTKPHITISSDVVSFLWTLLIHSITKRVITRLPFVSLHSWSRAWCLTEAPLRIMALRSYNIRKSFALSLHHTSCRSFGKEYSESAHGSWSQA